jgi:hypothetical protein
MKVKLPVVRGIVLCHALQVPHQLEHRQITNLNTTTVRANEGEASCCRQHCYPPCPTGHASAGTPSGSPPKHHTNVRLMKVKLPVGRGIVLCHALQVPHQLEHRPMAHLNTIQM